jgi:hypothetical protein
MLSVTLTVHQKFMTLALLQGLLWITRRSPAKASTSGACKKCTWAPRWSGPREHPDEAAHVSTQMKRLTWASRWSGHLANNHRDGSLSKWMRVSRHRVAWQDFNTNYYENRWRCVSGSLGWRCVISISLSLWKGPGARVSGECLWCFLHFIE